MSALGPSASEDDDAGDEELPERIIVVSAAAADAPDEPDELQAELDALAAEAAAEAAAGDPIDLDEVDLRSEPDPGDDGEPTGAYAITDFDEDDDDSTDAGTAGEDWAIFDAEDRDELFGDGGPTSGADLDAAFVDDEENLGPFQGQPGERRAELDALVAQVAASQVPDEDDHRDDTPPRSWPGRDETGPGTLRPKVPEPVAVVGNRTTVHRTVSKVRGLVGLMIVVLLAGVALAGAIGAAVLLVVLVLSRAFG